MNLNYGYDKHSMTSFVSTADTTRYIHNIAIDFDGEVILDPESHYPNVPIANYLFCTSCQHDDLKSPMQITALYDALEEKFNELTRKEFTLCGYYNTMKIAA